MTLNKYFLIIKEGIGLADRHRQPISFNTSPQIFGGDKHLSFCDGIGNSYKTVYLIVSSYK